MHCLIVESNPALGALWARYLGRLEVETTVAETAERALNLIQSVSFDVIVLDLVLSEGSALAVADLAQFRQPEANVVFVTNTTFFSDGSIFRHSANARAFIETATPPDDLAEIVHFFGVKPHARAVRQDQ
ncbi:response regulator [Yoonia litorea]|uniref:Response regulator receiver domain-containing protein n=1 Tax=Yoonia litorea TaxID=1123755 RepID=A0A1I6N0F5_9RHOB|nr:response regulator [Yoonia litorea]SFS21443.1 Response regulator receiver domain-containing protein [Yoonia litorea]